LSPRQHRDSFFVTTTGRRADGEAADLLHVLRPFVVSLINKAHCQPAWRAHTGGFA
jgi:hypothetical protein